MNQLPLYPKKNPLYRRRRRRKPGLGDMSFPGSVKQPTPGSIPGSKKPKHIPLKPRTRTKPVIGGASKEFTSNKEQLLRTKATQGQSLQHNAQTLATKVNSNMRKKVSSMSNGSAMGNSVQQLRNTNMKNKIMQARPEPHALRENSGVSTVIAAKRIAKKFRK